jgi:hypothetical protein
MMLGKRQRPPIKRTTSMTEIIFDLNSSCTEETHEPAKQQPLDPNNQFLQEVDQRFMASASVSPRPRTSQRRSSADFQVETAHFLRACSLCKRRLIPGRDIFMYRGDSAFCSAECRQQQMNKDEKKEKCSMASKKEVGINIATASPKISTKPSETVAAI